MPEQCSNNSIDARERNALATWERICLFLSFVHFVGRHSIGVQGSIGVGAGWGLVEADLMESVLRERSRLLWFQCCAVC
jgi:hypothetical protein